jgi:hypothetical protein
MKSSKFIYGGIGFVGLGIMSYFLYKKYGEGEGENEYEDEDERDLNNSIKNVQNMYGYTPKSMLDGGGKSRRRKTKSKNKSNKKSNKKSKSKK